MEKKTYTEQVQEQAQKAILKKKENNFLGMAAIGVITTIVFAVLSVLGVEICGNKENTMGNMIENLPEGKIVISQQMDDYLAQYKKGEISYNEYQDKVSKFGGEELKEKITLPEIEEKKAEINNWETACYAAAGVAGVGATMFGAGALLAHLCNKKFQKKYGYRENDKYDEIPNKELKRMIKNGTILEAEYKNVSGEKENSNDMIK